MKKKAFLIFIFTYNILLSQVDYKHDILPVEEEKVITANYKLYQNQLHEKYDSIFANSDNENEVECKYFIKSQLNYLKYSLEGGNIYSNWGYAQTYLNKLFNSIIPDVKSDSINIQIIRSTEVNAFITDMGKAYITVGFLAHALNEAEIAYALGHEYGHYIHRDAYHSFEKYLKNEESKKISLMLAGYRGNVFSLISTSNRYGNLRGMEREADEVAIDLTKKAGYNLLAGVNIQKRFKIIEEKEKKDKDYKPVGFYFHIHPPSGERIINIKNGANKSDTISTKYFKIDEKAFWKIKRQAVDECINLHMQRFEFEDCIELCYEQLLTNPNDEYYLFFINEALRRFLLMNPTEADKYFITGRYNIASKYLPKEKLPVYINSKLGLKPTDVRITQTIFYHYDYLMLTDKEKLFVNLPANELTKTDTLEFITNGEALDYFMGRQQKLKQPSVNWVKNCISNTTNQVNFTSVIESLNRYNQIKTQIQNCQSAHISDTTICAYLGLKYSGTSTFQEESYYDQCGDYLRQVLDTRFMFFNPKDLKPNEQETFRNIVFGINQLLPSNINFEPNKNKKFNIPLILLSPEAINFITKYNLQQFTMVKMHIDDLVTVSVSGQSLGYTLSFYKYYVDFKNGLFSFNIEKNPIHDDFDIKLKAANLNQSLLLLKK